VDAHAGQFAAHPSKTACAGCHNVQRWVPSTFDHGKRTKFPLEGGHFGVACDKCHKLNKIIDGKPVIFYNPTPLKCEACHGADMKQESKGRRGKDVAGNSLPRRGLEQSLALSALTGVDLAPANRVNVGNPSAF
jgi:hypothetical protein